MERSFFGIAEYQLAETMTHLPCSPAWRVQTRHPRFSLLQPGKVMDAGLRRHDGVVAAGESIFPPVGISSFRGCRDRIAPC
jgi:hypothetical protein